LLKFGYKFLPFGGKLSQTGAAGIAIALSAMPDAIIDLGGGSFRVHSELKIIHQSARHAISLNYKEPEGWYQHRPAPLVVAGRLSADLEQSFKVCSDGIILIATLTSWTSHAETVITSPVLAT
jgi:hypothetical protein